MHVCVDMCMYVRVRGRARPLREGDVERESRDGRALDLDLDLERRRERALDAAGEGVR